MSHPRIVTFRAYHGRRAPAEVSLALGLAPTRTIRKGGPSSMPELGRIPRNGWFRDYNLDVDTVNTPAPRLMDFIDHLAAKRVELDRLRANGWEINFFTFEKGGFDAEAEAIRTRLGITFWF